jgi:glycosyltransferase involved in cell wall biosynthesis
MKILHVMAGNTHGGAETACIDMCIAMHDAGEDVMIATRDNESRIQRLKDAGVPYKTLPFGGKIDIYTPWALKNLIKDFQPDIAQTWMSRAASKTPQYNPKSGGKPYSTFARLGNTYAMKYFKTMDYFVPITPDLRTYVTDHGVPETHARQINNFAETEEVETPLNRADYGVPSDATLILGLGRLHDDKAFDTLIECVNRMREDNVYLWIAGEGPDRAKLEAQINDLGLSDRVTLLGLRNDRAALLQACDICAFTSRDEPFGTVFVQCWAQKTTVIVSDADGPRQFVRDREDGMMTRIDNHDDIITAIKALQSDPNLCESLVKNGFERYKNEFTAEKTLESYLNFYQYACDSHQKTD